MKTVIKQTERKAPEDFSTIEEAYAFAAEQLESVNARINELAHELAHDGVFLQERPTDEEVRRVGLRLEQRAAELQEVRT